jgi:hypothetical protein
LSRSISLLRQVLADDSREPRFIRTIARIGYTLVPTPVPLASGAADRTTVLMPEAGSAVPVATDGAAVATISPTRIHWSTRLWNGRRRHALIAVGCIVLLIAVALLYAARSARPGVNVPPPVARKSLPWSRMPWVSANLLDLWGPSGGESAPCMSCGKVDTPRRSAQSSRLLGFDCER